MSDSAGRVQACCQPAPPEVKQPSPCTWPETDCWENGPGYAESGVNTCEKCGTSWVADVGVCPECLLIAPARTLSPDKTQNE